MLSRLFILFFCALTFSGCQLGYLIHVGYNHVAMLNSDVPVEDALKSQSLTDEQKRKINLAQEARLFAIEKLGLKKSKSYTKFVDLKRASVTYAVMASSKWKLEPYLWDFPFTGKVPYKGYYDEKLAKEEAERMKQQDYDVYVRGVSAFSTLGYLSDPLLSSMLAYADYDLVNTIIHELVHGTLYIADNADFNERLAMFVAGKGTEIFYFDKEGAESKTVQKIKDDNEDDALFSKFIGEELDQLKNWYEQYDHTLKQTPDQKEQSRQQRFDQIKESFAKNLEKKLKTSSYVNFPKRTMNNATLGTYHTYLKDLDVFEQVYVKNGSNIPAFLNKCKELKDSKDPEAELKRWADLP